MSNLTKRSLNIRKIIVIHEYSSYSAVFSGNLRLLRRITGIIFQSVLRFSNLRDFLSSMEIFHLYFSKIDSVFHTVIEPNICVLSAESAWQVDFNIETV